MMVGRVKSVHQNSSATSNEERLIAMATETINNADAVLAGMDIEPVLA